MFPDARPKPKPKSTVVALIVAVVVALVWSLVALPGTISGAGEALRTPGGGGYVLGLIVGASLVQSLVVWLVLYFVIVRRQGDTGRGGIHFLIILGSVVTFSLALFLVIKAGSDNTAREAAVAMDAVSTEVRKVVSSAPDTAVVDRTVRAKGVMGQLEATLKEATANGVADHQRYVAELRALGFPDRVKPAAVAKDPHLARALATLGDAKALVARYRQLGDTRVAEARAKLAALPLATADHDALLRGFDSRVPEDARFRKEMWDLEDAMVGEVEAAMRVLRRTEGHWQVQGGKTYGFEDGGAMNTFNGHMRRFDELSKQQAGMQAKHNAESLQRVEELAKATAADAKGR